MKISSISQEVVLPANVQGPVRNSGDGKSTREVSKRLEQSRLAIRDRLSQEAKPPVEPIVNGYGLGLRFYLDRDTGIRVIQVIDAESGDVIRQIPPDEVVNFMRHFEDSKGHFVCSRF
jgi:flagellar protein FlaG